MTQAPLRTGRPFALLRPSLFATLGLMWRTPPKVRCPGANTNELKIINDHGSTDTPPKRVDVILLGLLQSISSVCAPLTKRNQRL